MAKTNEAWSMPSWVDAREVPLGLWNGAPCRAGGGALAPRGLYFMSWLVSHAPGPCTAPMLTDLCRFGMEHVWLELNEETLRGIARRLCARFDVEQKSNAGEALALLLATVPVFHASFWKIADMRLTPPQLDSPRWLLRCAAHVALSDLLFAKLCALYSSEGWSNKGIVLVTDEGDENYSVTYEGIGEDATPVKVEFVCTTKMSSVTGQRQVFSGPQGSEPRRQIYSPAMYNVDRFSADGPVQVLNAALDTVEHLLAEKAR